MSNCVYLGRLYACPLRRIETFMQTQCIPGEAATCPPRTHLGARSLAAPSQGDWAYDLLPILRRLRLPPEAQLLKVTFP